MEADVEQNYLSRNPHSGDCGNRGSDALYKSVLAARLGPEQLTCFKYSQ